MGIEMIVGLVITVLGAIVGAFRLGHVRGTNKAEAREEKRRIEEYVAANQAAAQRRVEVTKEASNVQQTVNHMHDSDVARELRENWIRKD